MILMTTIFGIDMILLSMLMNLEIEAWQFYVLIFSLRIVQGFVGGLLLTLVYSLMIKHLDS